MQNITVWHNPRCSKSRDALVYLDKKGIIPTIVKYLDETPSFDEIKNILKLLDMNARDLMRKKEDIYKELNLKDVASEDELIKAMVENPKLIERPVVINENRAVIARPLENIDRIL
ncbi:MAG: arsenate reductase (glutaredoxin) [Arcobacter sp.]|nr:MAG: arsenate reductase (glutaredoxin) [Arcobacter sp.]